VKSGFVQKVLDFVDGAAHGSIKKRTLRKSTTA
jgi:hypothetical protein